MKRPRRSVLKAGAAAAAMSLLPPKLRADAADRKDEFDRAHDGIRRDLLEHFGSLGYSPAPAVSISTGNVTFNGGLRYDDTGLIDLPAQMIIQHCSRLEDIAEPRRIDRLPFFHIFRCNRPQGHKPHQSLAQILTYLTGPFGIDVSRLTIISGPALEDYFPVLRRMQMEPGHQAFLRDEAQARISADGSGYWRFPGNPGATPVATAGIYCWIGVGAPTTIDQYPPSQDWTEIGEALLDDSDSLGFALGTERLTLVKTGLFPTWAEQLAVLLASIDSENEGLAPPPGRELFEKS